MKTNKKHFVLFKQECQKWIDKFELNNWTVCYNWRDITNEGLDGSCNSGGYDYTAEFILDTEIDKENFGDIKDTEIIKNCAKHEVLHLLIKRLKLKAIDRYIKNEKEIVEAEEELVRKLENIIH